MAETTLISYDGRVLNREELSLVHTPAGTNTHKPVPHHEVVNALVETLGFRHIAVHKEQYALDKTGMKLFGTMELETTHGGCRFALGIRNSHDKSLSLAITVGFRVLVCENLSFYGDYNPVMRKHTRSFNLLDALSLGVDNIQRNWKPMVETIDRWQQTQITEVTAKLLIYEAFIEGSLELPKHLAKPVHDYYFNPPHEEFQPRTMWSLQNSFTGAMKQLDPIPQARATTALAKFFDSRHL